MPLTTEERIVAIISDLLAVDEAEVTPGANFVTDLGADSLDRVELVMSLEETFDISITDEEAEKVKTVQDAYNIVGKKAKK